MSNNTSSIVQFIEGATFKTTIPFDSIAREGTNKGTMKGGNKGAIEGAIEGATKGVKGKLADLLSVIFTNEGKRVPDYKEITGLPESTLEGYIKRLRDADLVEFKGESAQTGGYFLTKKMKAKLK